MPPALLLLALLAAPPSPSPVEQAIATRVHAFAGIMGVFAQDLETGETVAVDADRRFPTASAIKTAVMVEVMHQVSAGKLRRDQLVTLTDAVKVGGSGVLRQLRAGSEWSVADLLSLMITISDNTATNMLVGLVGTQAVDDRMVSYGLRQTRLYRPTFRGGHPDVYPEEEKEYGLGSTTPREMARLMELIARGQAVSPEISKQMVAVLAKQQDDDMIPRRLPADAEVAHKTGMDEEKLPDASGLTGLVHADAGIVTTPKGRYVVAILARRGKDMRETADNDALVTGAEISRLLWDHFTGADRK
jgi:beta-lactamase class A